MRNVVGADMDADKDGGGVADDQSGVPVGAVPLVGANSDALRGHEHLLDN